MAYKDFYDWLLKALAHISAHITDCIISRDAVDPGFLVLHIYITCLRFRNLHM